MAEQCGECGRTAREGRDELLVQLYYDRADAAQHDLAAARILDVVITILSPGKKAGDGGAFSKKTDRALH